MATEQVGDGGRYAIGWMAVAVVVWALLALAWVIL